MTLILPAVPVGVKPEPVQDVALVELHESAADWPAVIEVGLTLRSAVGAGVVTVPPVGRL